MRAGIVMLTYNEPYSALSECFQTILNSLSSLQFPEGQLDVLFVDNKSGPEYLKSLHTFCETHTRDGLTFSYLSESETSAMFNSTNLGFHTFRSRHDYDILAYSADDVWLNAPGDFSAAVLEMQADPSIGILSIQSEWCNSIMHPDNHSLSYFPRLESRGGPPIAMTPEELVCFHFGLFSREYLEAYDYRYPDAFQSFGSEGILHFFTAAAGLSWSMSRSSVLCNGKFRYQYPKLGRYIKKCAKQGRTAHPWREKGFSGMLIEPSIGKTFEELIAPGKPLGLGFNCWQRIAQLGPDVGFWMDYDPECYEDGKLKDPEALKSYLKENMFLPSPEYDARIERATKLLNI